MVSRPLLLVLCCVEYAAGASGNVYISKPTTVLGKLTTTSLVADAITAKGAAHIEGSISGVEVTTKRLTANTIEASVISSPTGTITVDRNLVLVQTSGAGGSSFLELDQTSWKEISIEHFDSEKAENEAKMWGAQLSHCQGKDGSTVLTPIDRFLGGRCNSGPGSNISRTFQNLPPHQYIRVSGKVHQIDQWRGEHSYVKIGDRIVWNHASPTTPNSKGLDICGAEAPETAMSIPVDVTQPHSSHSVSITFGATGDPNSNACSQSFGVDDIAIYLK
ncbi:hypothetical protein AAMO2058_000944500 [Amorphochlora amoebiformis]